MSDAEPFDDLVEQLKSSGARVTFDRGRDHNHPCTFCARPGEPTHRLRDIGRYPNGTRITRPVCAHCSGLADALEEPEKVFRFDSAKLDIDELLRVIHQLETQNNAATDAPVFVVQRRERFYGVEVEDYGSEGGSEGGTELGEERGWCWIEDFQLVDPERFAELEAQKDDPPAFARRTGYLEFWQADQVFLTREAAEGYIKSQAHNLGRARVWTASAHRNYEWQWLRSFLPAVTGQLSELTHALQRTNSTLSISESMLLASEQRLTKMIELEKELDASRARVAELEERLSQYECLICDDEIGSCDCIDPPNYDEACGECGAAAGEEKHRSNHLDTCPKCQREHRLYPSKE